MGMADALLHKPRRILRRYWRERCWESISPAEYRAAFERLGGSIQLHPDVVALAAELAGIEPRFIVLRGQDAPEAALPLLGGYVGATLESLAANGLVEQLDIGNSEVVLPIGPGPAIQLPLYVGHLSCLHAGALRGIVPERRRHMLSRPDGAGGRRQLQQFLTRGGTIQPVTDLRPADIASIYARLFHSRFGFQAPAIETMPQVFERLWSLLRGSVLNMDGAPIAIHIAYGHSTRRGLLVAGVNGGVDQNYRQLGPGRILHYLNIRALQAEAATLDMPLRYSFGFDDNKYKEDWCSSEPLYASVL